LYISYNFIIFKYCDIQHCTSWIDMLVSVQIVFQTEVGSSAPKHVGVLNLL